MKILYDGTMFANQAAGGINRYFANIISRFPSEFEPALLTFNVRAHNWPVHPKLRIYQAPLFAPDRVARLLGRYYFRAAARQFKPDIVHPTYYYSLGVRRLNSYGCPSVVTVYDFIHDILAPAPAVQQLEVSSQAQAIADADAILCISNHTKSDLLERFPNYESKVHVTPLASDIHFSMTQGEEPIPDRPYFFFVGSRPSYKNFEGLARAFARLAQSDPEVCLAVVGTPFTPTENKLFDELKITARVQPWGIVSDAHLARLYRHSLALVYPSFYEGFGIPPLEAMACETVVIAANNSSIPEVTGDAALLFDAAKTDELFDLLRTVARGEANRADIIAKGRARAAQFSWERTAQQTAEVYRSLL